MTGQTLKPSFQKTALGMMQTEYLIQAEKSLGVGPVEMARLLNTNYNTYKAWKNGRNKMPGVAYKAIELLI